MISRESGEMAQWLKALAGKPGTLSSILEPTRWKEKLRKEGGMENPDAVCGTQAGSKVWPWVTAFNI